MSVDKNPTVAYTMANKLAWVSLLDALFMEGAVDPRIVHSNLKRYREGLSRDGFDDICEALDDFLDSVQGVMNAEREPVGNKP